MTTPNPSAMTPTPRTDAARGFFDMETAVDAEEMAKLERELTELRDINARMLQELNGILWGDKIDLTKLQAALAAVTAERDALRALGVAYVPPKDWKSFKEGRAPELSDCEEIDLSSYTNHEPHQPNLPDVRPLHFR